MTTEANEPTAFLEHILPAIDRHLAELDTHLRDRPLHATVVFVQEFVEAVQEDGAPATALEDAGNFMLTRWFAVLYGRVEEWYRRRYPATMWEEHDNRLFGIVPIAGTVFASRVPAVRIRPDRPGETMWISFPDGLREGETALDWVEAPPNLEMLSQKERRDAEQCATEVADALRCIWTGLMALKTGHDQLDGLKAGILPRLKRAAELLLEPGPSPVQQACWELQLACEIALKALCRERTGGFKETHDLFVLYDAVPAPGPAFNRNLLKRLPRWEETVDLRYGQGTRESRTDCAKCYRAALAIVAGTVRSMKKGMNVGQAEIKIARAPWLNLAR